MGAPNAEKVGAEGWGPKFESPSKYQEKTPKRGKKERKLWREREKRAKFWVVWRRGVRRRGVPRTMVQRRGSSGGGPAVGVPVGGGSRGGVVRENGGLGAPIYTAKTKFFKKKLKIIFFKKI